MAFHVHVVTNIFRKYSLIIWALLLKGPSDMWALNFYSCPNWSLIYRGNWGLRGLPKLCTMAAAQVAKKLKDKRQQRTIEGIFKKVRQTQNRKGNCRERKMDYLLLFLEISNGWSALKNFRATVLNWIFWFSTSQLPRRSNFIQSEKK